MKKSKLQKHTDNPDCDCFFCKSACPTCGAKDIKISFLPRFEFSFPEDDYIEISHDIDTLELICFECDSYFLYDEQNEGDEYKSLAKEIFDALDLADSYSVKKDKSGKINTRKWDICIKSDNTLEMNSRKE